MDEGFQFVDLDATNQSNDFDKLKEEVQTLTKQYSSEPSKLKSLEKEINDNRQTTNSIMEEIKKLKEEKRKMKEEMSNLEKTQIELLQQLQSIKEEVMTFKKKEKEQEKVEKEKIEKEKEKLCNYSSSDICETGPCIIEEITQVQNEGEQPQKEVTTSTTTNSGSSNSGNNKTTTTATTTTTASTTATTSLKELDKSQCYACKQCGTHIGLESDVINKCYQVGQGAFTEKKRGYLFGNAVNLVLGTTKTENFSTGSYEISWLTCAKCNTSLGWKYLSASNESNNSKVGKFCLARYSLTSPQDRNQQ